jgi:hypothetical protein
MYSIYYTWRLLLKIYNLFNFACRSQMNFTIIFNSKIIISLELIVFNDVKC